jgi:hypothetical protein
LETGRAIAAKSHFAAAKSILQHYTLVVFQIIH